MKIGILTHHYVANYGAFLQAYCLWKTLSELFPNDDVRVIDYINRKHMFINACGYLRFHPSRESVAAWFDKTRMPGIFAKARKENLRLTKRVFSASELNALGLDAVVVGSDEVWNYRDPKSYTDVKFGCGIGEQLKLVSYAASVGGIRTFDDLPTGVAQGLKRYSALSVRDDNTEAFVHTVVGRTPARVIDPVFLHALPDGLTPRVQALTAAPYILFYHCAPLPESARADIAAYAREKGLRLLGAGEYNTLYDQRSIDLTPFEWAEMFRQAQYVITGTFHGAVFSIVNRRPLSVCPNNPIRAEKLRSLLDEFGLASRMVAPESFRLRDAADQAIDYAAISACVAQKAQASKAYLTQALQ